MKREIQSISELRQEIERLHNFKEQKESDIKLKVQQLSLALSPVNIAKNAVQTISQNKEIRNNLASIGTEAVIGFILSNILLKKSNPVIKATAAILGTTLAETLLGDHAGNVIAKVKELFQRFKKMKDEKNDSFDEKDIYNS